MRTIGPWDREETKDIADVVESPTTRSYIRQAPGVRSSLVILREVDAAGVVDAMGTHVDVEMEIVVIEFGPLGLDVDVVGTTAGDDGVSTTLVSAPRHNIE